MTSLKRRSAMSCVVLAAYVLVGATGLCAQDKLPSQEGPWVKLSFGPAIERVLPTKGPGAQCFLDLDTGTLYAAPEEIAGDEKATDAWCSRTGIDVRRGGAAEGAVGLEMLDMRAKLVRGDSWAESPQGIAARVENAQDCRGMELSSDPATMVFATRGGGRGVLQVVGADPPSRGVKIRYKMVESEPAMQGWGGEVLGLQLGLSVERVSRRDELVMPGEEVGLTVGSPAAYLLGESVIFRCYLRSSVGGFRVSRKPASLALTIIGPDGVRKEDWWAGYWAERRKPELPWTVLKGAAAFPVLPAHRGHVEIGFHPHDVGPRVGHRVRFLEPGVYRLRASYSFDGRAVNACTDWAPQAWEGGSVSSGEVSLAVSVGEVIATPSEVARLTKALGSVDVAERLAALDALGRVGHAATPAISALVGLLGDDATQRVRDPTVRGYHDVRVRYEASRVLQGLGPAAVPPLLSVLKAGPDRLARPVAAWTLGGILGVPSGPSDLAHYCRVGPPLAAPWPYGWPRSDIECSRFRAWLGSIQDPKLRAAAHAPKGSLEGQAMGALLAALDKHYEPIATYCSTAKLNLGNGRVDIAPVIAALKDKDGRVRAFAAGLLGRLGLVEAVQPLIEALAASCTVGGTAEIWSALGSIGAPAVGPLIETIGDPNARIREEAGWALFGIRGPKAADQVVAGLRHRDALVRKWCAHTLAAMGDPRAVGPLIGALVDEDHEVRAAAASALGQICEARDKVMARLTRLLKEDRHWEVRKTAAWALGRFPLLTVGARAALENASKTDEHEVVRSGASEVMRKLDELGRSAQ